MADVESGVISLGWGVSGARFFSPGSFKPVPFASFLSPGVCPPGSGPEVGCCWGRGSVCFFVFLAGPGWSAQKQHEMQKPYGAKVLLYDNKHRFRVRAWGLRVR